MTLPRQSPSGVILQLSSASYQFSRNVTGGDAGTTVALFDALSNAREIQAPRSGFIRSVNFNAFAFPGGWTAGVLTPEIEIAGMLAAAFAAISAPGSVYSLETSIRFQSGDTIRALVTVSNPFTTTNNVRPALQLNLTYDP